MRARLELGVVLFSTACRFDAATTVDGPVETHELAAVHFGDGHYRGLCDLARQVCEETNAHCHACVEGASTTAAHAG